MKKILLIFSLIFFNSAFSQMAVIDATANKQMAKQISQSVTQIRQLENTYNVLKEAKEKYEKVNGYVSQMGQLQNIINQQKQAVNNANKCLQKARNGRVSLRDVETNLRQISGSIKTIQAVLSNGFFNMSDAERIAILDKELQRAKTANTAIRVKLIKLSY